MVVSSAMVRPHTLLSRFTRLMESAIVHRTAVWRWQEQLTWWDWWDWWDWRIGR